MTKRFKKNEAPSRTRDNIFSFFGGAKSSEAEKKKYTILSLAGGQGFSAKEDNKMRRGFGVVELIVVIFIMATALVSLMGLYNIFMKTREQTAKYIQATSLAQEEIEAARNIRDDSWSNISSLSVDTAYHPIETGTPLKWSLSAGQETINGFSRKVVLSKVYRDASDNIIDSGGTEDAGSRKITATVSWAKAGQNYSINLFAYLTNWRP